MHPVSSVALIGLFHFCFSLPIPRAVENEIPASDWMAHLPENVTARSLAHIAIPGTHNSGSYSIKPLSPISPDMDLGFLANFLGFFFNISFFKWSVTQLTDFTTQLQNGIRYFDLRVAFGTDYCSDSVPKDTSKIYRCFYLVHGQYASPVADEFKAIRKFLNEHPKEVVILDFQHFHAMDEQRKTVFTRLVEESFGDLMEPERHRIPSLDELWERKKQVIALGSEKQSNAPASEPPSLWTRNHIHQPWANTRDAEELRTFLSRNYKLWIKTNKDDRFFVFQGILSPNFDYIMNNPSSNLEKMAKISNMVVKEWLDCADLFHGIVITDFSILGYPEFSRQVFSMNW